MSASRTHCQKQMLRMSGIRRYPLVDEAISEVLNILTNCVSDNHATDTVDALLGSCTEFPTPKEIRDTAYEKRPPATATNCQRCNGLGFQSRQNQRGEWFAAVCECRKQGAA